LLPGSEPHEHEAILEEALFNDGAQTETDYLGHNNDTDDALVDALFAMYKVDNTTKGNISIQLESFKAFSNNTSNMYVWQDYVCDQEDEICGGFCSITWRSVLQRQLCDSRKHSTLEDAQLLFNMTQHTMNNTQEQNDIFLDMMDDIHNHTSGKDFSGFIPTDHQSMKDILLESKFGIFGNLPHKEVFGLAGHACVSLIGLLKHTMAHKIPI
jgi:hypothetical protein